MAGGVEPNSVEEGKPALQRAQAGRLAEWAKRGWSLALDVVFPIGCFGCDARGRFICAECARAMPRLDHPFCEICASPGVIGVCSWCEERSPAMDTIRSPYLYTPDSPIHKAITSLKYRGMRSVAPELADLLACFLSRQPTIRADVVVPTPSHPSRVRRRGYGQAALVSTALARRLCLPADSHALARVSDAPSQLETDSRKERWAQVQNGFECASRLDGATVLLVDDLVTTGSTASACATALKRAGARRVVGVSVARAE